MDKRFYLVRVKYECEKSKIFIGDMKIIDLSKSL